MKLISALLLLTIWPFAIGFSAENSEPVSLYVFRGVDVSALINGNEAPVISANKKRVYVETARGVKKIRYSSRFRNFPKTSIATRLVEVTEFTLRFDFLRRYELETQAMTEMMRHESMIQSEISKLSGSNVGRVNARQIEKLTDTQENLEESVLSSIEDDQFNSDTLKDFVSARMVIQPPVDIESAYCVMTMQYLRPDGNTMNRLTPIFITRIHHIGDLLADIPTKVKVNFRIPEGYFHTFKYQFHLLSGESMNWGTNISNGIRKLTQEEISKLMKLQSP